MATQLEESLETLIASTRQAWQTGNAPETLANATLYLKGFGHLTLAWIWLDLAINSTELIHKQSGREKFHQGKLAAAQYFFDFELPLIQTWLKPVANRNPLFRELNSESL